MIYLIAQNKTDVGNANKQISINMGFGDPDSDSTTTAWDQPRQINAASGEGLTAIPAHPVYLIDASKVGWWAIQKPETRFMTGVSLTEINA